MRSINVKRIAAVATGVAMVGSVMASGLAVTHQGDVSDLVSNIKANLDDTQVVVGTHGADISDGVQAAKLAAVLASVNYAAVSEGSVSITDKSVLLETSAGATEQITSSNYPVGLAATAAGTSGHWASISGANATVTRTMMPDVLSQKTLQATVNGTSTSYLYEDSIRVSGVNAVYSESTTTNLAGHGLYMNAPYSSGAFEYRIDFTGNGLPVGTGRYYTAIPEIDVLGHTIGIDYATATDGLLTIYSGTKSTMMTGDEVTTTSGYKVRLNSVTQGSGTTYYAIYTATDPSGATETSTQLATAGSYNFFANAISVYCDYVGYDQSAAKGTTITRVTGGKQYLQDSTAFPLDLDWTVKEVNVSGSAPDQFLRYISLKYGSATNPPQWTGTFQTGLAQGVVVDGPKMADGTPKYQMKVKGFGSASAIVDTTKVEVASMGSSGSGITSTHLLQPTWTARDGSEQKLDATLPDQVVIPAAGATVASFNSATARYMIINDKVVYLSAVTPATTSGTVPTYTLTFKIGGLAGSDVTIGPINATGQTATLSHLTNVNPISCVVSLGPVGGTVADPTNITVTASGAMSTTDVSTNTCDIYPNLVPFGRSTSIDPTAAPYLDLSFIQGNASSNVPSTNANPVQFNSSGTMKYWPAMRIVGPAGTDNVTIVYDSEPGSDGLTGLLAYGNLNLYQYQGGAYNNTGNYTTYSPINSEALLINQPVTSTSATESTKYDVTPWSTELDGSVLNALSAIVPESRRDAIFEISQTISEGAVTGGEYTATEGQTIGNVKVKTIACEASVSGSNMFSPVKTVMPERLVTTDAAASASYQIVVGGPWVNSVAQGIAGNDLVTKSAGASYLIADGNKLLVAGFAAADTASAADALVTLLKSA
jgi:hypothetical protein